MSWMIELTFAILLTSVTGSILLLLWYFIGRLLQRSGYLNIQYLLLKIELLFFVIPVFYLYFTRNSNLVLMKAGGVLFLETPVIRTGSLIFSAVWLSGVIMISAIYIFDIVRLYWRNRGKIPCVKEVEECFHAVCKKLNIPQGRVRLYRSYRIQVPELIGVLHPVVMLPVEDFTPEEMQVIFIHELTHYRQKDIEIKYLVTLILVIHFFNPVVWWLHMSIRKWSEFTCDSKACEPAGGIKKYFEVILKIATDRGNIGPFFTARLTEDAHEILKRVEYMKKYKAFRKKSPGIIAGICTVLLVCSSVSVYAASVEALEQYRDLYRATVVEEQEVLDPELPEYTEAPGESNLPDQKDGGKKTLNVSSNNGDVNIEFVND